MALAGIVTLLLAEPASSAPRGAFRPIPGVRAHVTLPGMKALPIPVSRLGFDEANRGFAESDETGVGRQRTQRSRLARAECSARANHAHRGSLFGAEASSTP